MDVCMHHYLVNGLIINVKELQIKINIIVQIYQRIIIKKDVLNIVQIHVNLMIFYKNVQIK